MKKLPILLGGLLALLIGAGAVGATVVYADDATPPAPTGQPGGGRARAASVSARTNWRSRPRRLV